MDGKQVYKEIKEIDNDRQALDDRRRYIINQFIYNTGFQNGDKVRYRSDVYFIRRLYISFPFGSEECEVTCDLTSPKKDGTIPLTMKNGHYCVNVNELEKVD